MACLFSLTRVHSSEISVVMFRPSNIFRKLQERAVERLIRAELNLVAIKNRQMHKQRGFRRSVYLVFEWLEIVLTGQREKARDKFTYSVDFKQFITSLMAWRTPWLVSADVKRQRQPLLVRDFLDLQLTSSIYCFVRV